MQKLYAKHKELMEQQELDHRDDVAFFEQQIARLCQGAPQRGKVVQERLKERGRLAELRAAREELPAPPVLPPMPEEAIVDDALEEEEEDASMVEAKAPPSASATAQEWSPSWK